VLIAIKKIVALGLISASTFSANGTWAITSQRETEVIIRFAGRTI